MTKHKKMSGKSSGQRQKSAAGSKWISGRKIAPRSQTAANWKGGRKIAQRGQTTANWTGGRNIAQRSQTGFKQQKWGQNGGRRRGNNNQNQGSYGLSYQFSQQRGGGAQASSSFSSFFAPSKSSFEQPKFVELGLLIRKHWVGGLIGKKGKTIWMIRDKSNGANIDFGNDDLVIDRSNDKKWEQSPWPQQDKEKFCVCAISGSKAQAADAAIAIAEQLAKGAQSSDYRLEFLIPEAYVGTFIGKKGSNLKQMKGPAGNGVSINIRDEPITLGGNKVTLCTLFGPAGEVGKTIERAAKWLGDISIRVQVERDSQQPN